MRWSTIYNGIDRAFKTLHSHIHATFSRLGYTTLYRNALSQQYATPKLIYMQYCTNVAGNRLPKLTRQAQQFESNSEHAGQENVTLAVDNVVLKHSLDTNSKLKDSVATYTCVYLGLHKTKDFSEHTFPFKSKI